MRKILPILICLLLILPIQATAKNWLLPANDGTIGGTAGKLDNIDSCDANGAGYNLQNKDGAIVWDQTGGRFLFYIWDYASTDGEVDPTIIVPDACNGGAHSDYPGGASGDDGRWILVDVQTSGGLLATQLAAKQATVTEGSLADSVIVSADVKDGVLLDADVNVSADIANTKLAAGRKRTSAPGSPVAGAPYFADGATWDPAGIYGVIGVAYYVIYDGAAYIPTRDEDGVAYFDTIQAAMNILSFGAESTDLAAAQLNSIIVKTGAGDVNIPADQCDAATGAWLSVKSNAAHLNSVTSDDGADVFQLSDGTLLDVGDELDLAGAANSRVTVVCDEANVWSVSGEIGTCVDGGGAD